jgi:hypothetical protein
LYTYRTQKNNFYVQGFGRHTDDEIKSLIAQAVQMMATFVKEEDRLADIDRPCLVQATFFGFLMSMYRVKIENGVNGMDSRDGKVSRIRDMDTKDCSKVLP